MNQYTDTQLKQALAKMLPDTYVWYVNPQFPSQASLRVKITGYEVLDTELLYLCWLVEETLNGVEQVNYAAVLWKLHPSSELEGYKWNQQALHDTIWRHLNHATWQQRCTALCKVKGITI